ncbi:MAG TPA: amino acid permease [Solirubrobacteraceae bacterium]|nr:amino acid permease [Solirubrobacteraceae bacterium]
MARLTEHGLRRSVGVSGLFATAYGNVGSSIYYALGLVAAHALGLTPLVFLFAGGLFALTAKTYAEGASMFPEAGGSSSFARHAFNDVVSFFAGWALSLDYILTIAISAFFVPHYLSAFPGLHALNHNPDDIVGGLVVVGVLAALNIRGLGESAKLNFILAIADLSTQVLLVVVGAVLVLSPHLLIHQVHLGSVPSWGELIFALSLAMLAYTGIETVANMAEESRDPGRQVPKAVNLVVLAVLGVYAGISVVALSALPVVHHGIGYSPQLHEHFSTPGHATALGGFFQNDPVLGIISRLGLHGTVLHIAQYYVGVLAATILFIATNAGMIGISRLSWSLSEHRQLPSIFSRLHSRFRTPWFTLVFFSGLAGVLILYGDTEVLGNLYSFGAMLSFTTAHVAVIALRVKDPDRERPYRMPGNLRIHGADIPLSAVLGGIGTAAAWVAVVVFHAEARVVGIPWMVVGMAGYYFYRRRQGLDPLKSYKIERAARPADFEAFEYSTALVPIFGADVSASALHSAAKLIGEDGVVYAIFVLPVPNQLSLDAGMEEEEAHGRSVLESARIQARRAQIKIHTALIRTRNPGAALVQEAEKVGADVIYWSTIHAPAGEQGIGPTAAYLLGRRPCRVIVETENRATRELRDGVPGASAASRADGAGGGAPAAKPVSRAAAPS